MLFVKKLSSVLTHLYSGKPPCPIAHQTALSSVNDATASPPSSVLLMNNRSAEFRQSFARYKCVSTLVTFSNYIRNYKNFQFPKFVAFGRQ